MERDPMERDPTTLDYRAAFHGLYWKYRHAPDWNNNKNTHKNRHTCLLDSKIQSQTQAFNFWPKMKALPD